jgi:hypothetical protein
MERGGLLLPTGFVISPKLEYAFESLRQALARSGESKHGFVRHHHHRAKLGIGISAEAVFDFLSRYAAVSFKWEFEIAVEQTSGLGSDIRIAIGRYLVVGVELILFSHLAWTP